MSANLSSTPNAAIAPAAVLAEPGSRNFLPAAPASGWKRAALAPLVGAAAGAIGGGATGVVVVLAAGLPYLFNNPTLPPADFISGSLSLGSASLLLGIFGALLGAFAGLFAGVLLTPLTILIRGRRVLDALLAAIVVGAIVFPKFVEFERLSRELWDAFYVEVRVAACTLAAAAVVFLLGRPVNDSSSATSSPSATGSTPQMDAAPVTDSTPS